MKKILISCAIIALTFSCKKEDVTVNSENVIENSDHSPMRGYSEFVDARVYADYCGVKNRRFASLYAELTESRTQTFTVEADRRIRIVGDQGTVLEIRPESFVDGRGEPVRGEIEITLIEVFNRADMILLDKATNGVSEDGSYVSALSSAGEVFIEARQGGDIVDLITPMRVTVASSSADADMTKFTEVDMPGDDLLWEKAEDDVDVVGGEEGGRGSYAFEILPGEWGWTNLDKWVVDPCAKTELFVQVPSGYDNTNTEVYLSYDGDPGRLANFDTWNGTMFTEHYGQICIGIDVHFIAVSNLGGSLEYAIQAATIVGSHIEIISSLSPISEAALIALINGLP